MRPQRLSSRHLPLVSPEHQLWPSRLQQPSPQLLQPVSVALAFRQNKDGSYEPEEDTDRFQSAGACYILWRKGIAVHVENTDIKEVMICSDDTETIPVTEYPFNAFYENERRSYRIYCLDAYGNVISEL